MSAEAKPPDKQSAKARRDNTDQTRRVEYERHGRVNRGEFKRKGIAMGFAQLSWSGGGLSWNGIQSLV
ncbi:hypothetical protein MishRS11D_36230 [Methylomagnum ishizawai]|nr:hypothetical protein MishRS11D_36230 [Methylomagnum ishizawai]